MKAVPSRRVFDRFRRRGPAAIVFLLCAGWFAVLPFGAGLAFRGSLRAASAPPVQAAASARLHAGARVVAASLPRAAQRPAGAKLDPAAAARLARLRALSSPARFPYYPIARRLAARHSVEFRLVMAIIASESGGDPEAVSPAGAVGLMQLMPDTAAKLGVDPLDPEQNLDGAIRYLGSLLSSFRSVDLSLVAYNAGPGFAARYRAGQVELGAETRAFLIRIGKLLD